jgi:predicted anti-sigma-YlaC factor YlaD
MDHQKIKELISPYHEGELNEEEKKRVEKHLKECSECKKEFEEMGKFEEVMEKMELKKLPKEAWKMYWSSVYNRLERRIGWILLEDTNWWRDSFKPLTSRFSSRSRS